MKNLLIKFLWWALRTLKKVENVDDDGICPCCELYKSHSPDCELGKLKKKIMTELTQKEDHNGRTE